MCKGSVDKEIKDLVQEYYYDNDDFEEAMKKAIREKRHIFSALLDKYEDSDSECSSSEYDSDDENDWHYIMR